MATMVDMAVKDTNRLPLKKADGWTTSDGAYLLRRFAYADAFFQGRIGSRWWPLCGMDKMFKRQRTCLPVSRFRVSPDPAGGIGDFTALASLLVMT